MGTDVPNIYYLCENRNEDLPVCVKYTGKGGRFF